VTQEQGEQFARKIRAKQYIECSALTQKNLKMAFDSALLGGLDHRNKYIPRPIGASTTSTTSRISPGARLRKSMRRLSLLTSRKKLTRHRDSADSDSSLTSSASSSSSMLSDSSLSDSPSTGSSTYSKTFDPERMESQLSIKSQLRSMITCFG
jgi:beta-glucanase (GH16 family)